MKSFFDFLCISLYLRKTVCCACIASKYWLYQCIYMYQKWKYCSSSAGTYTERTYQYWPSTRVHYAQQLVSVFWEKQHLVKQVADRNRFQKQLLIVFSLPWVRYPPATGLIEHLGNVNVQSCLLFFSMFDNEPAILLTDWVLDSQSDLTESCLTIITIIGLGISNIKEDNSYVNMSYY